MSAFSVIIPTLQRSKELHELVEQCVAHPLVLEVLVINNAPAPLAWESPKVRVFQQAENIYVNPAWNLGASEARGKYLAILNDDVLFDTVLLDHVDAWLRDDSVGVIGVDPECYEHTGPPTPCLTEAVGDRPGGFGVAMFMRRDRYIPVPDGLRIYFGDDWFIRMIPTARRFSGVRLYTDMSVTSGLPQFSPLAHADIRWERLNMWRYGTPRQRLTSLPGAARFIAVRTARKLRLGRVLDAVKAPR